jgi:hypothetical protein
MDAPTRNGAREPPQQIVLADTENHTGDSTLGFVVTQLLQIDLSQSTRVSLADPAAELRLMQREPGVAIDLDLAREIATRKGLKAVLAGEISSAGGAYVISARFVAAETGEVLIADRETASDSTQIITATDRLSKRLRNEIGESMVSIRASLPLYSAASPSLAALRKFTMGGRALNAGERERAIALWEEAVAIDTGFAAVHRYLGVLYNNAGDDGGRHLLPGGGRARQRDHRLSQLARSGFCEYESAREPRTDVWCRRPIRAGSRPPTPVPRRLP